MHTKIIKNIGTELYQPIIWDCFRGSYTQLMYTCPYVIECTFNIEIDIINPQIEIKPQIKLHFKMYNTNGSQGSQRKVI